MTNTTLDTLFPGYKARETGACEGIAYSVLSASHSVDRSPCYAYGYEIGEDVSHTFQARLLVAPRTGAVLAAPGHAAFEISGYSMVSERYDQNSATVRCSLGGAPFAEVEYSYYYQKYGGQSERRRAPLEEHVRYFREHLGYDDLSEEKFASFARTLRGRYSY